MICRNNSGISWHWSTNRGMTDMVFVLRQLQENAMNKTRVSMLLLSAAQKLFSQ